MKIPLVGPSSEARSLISDAQRTINLYVESGGSKSARGFYGKPGSRTRRVAGGGVPITAIAAINGRLFVLDNGFLREYNSSWVLQQSASGITSVPNNQDYIILNGLPHFLQALIVANGACYFWQDLDATVTLLTLEDLGIPPPDGAGGQCDVDSTGLFVQNAGDPFDHFDVASMGGQAITINGGTYTVDYVLNPWQLVVTTPVALAPLTDVAWSATGLALTASSATFLGGYAIVSRFDSRQFNISGLNDFLHWSSLDFELKEGYSDNLVKLIAHNGELWLFGSETREVWSQTGNPDFPFQRNPSGSRKGGLGGTGKTLCEVGLESPRLYWLGGDGCAYRNQGLSVERISTPAQEHDWKNAFLEATGLEYSMAGHVFWQLNFPAVSLGVPAKTWCYDVTENIWTERGLLTGPGTLQTRDLPQWHAYVPNWVGDRLAIDEGATVGTHVVTNYADSKLLEISTDFYDDDGGDIRYVRRFAHMNNDGKKLTWHRLVLEVEMAELTPGDGPIIELRISEDGGKTWRQKVGGGDLIVTQEIASATMIDATTRRIVFRQLGSARDFVAEIACTSKSKMVILDAYGEVSPGNA